MYKLTTLFIVAIALMLGSSCKKAIDCVGESLLISVDITPDGNDPNQIEFEVDYFGDFELVEIRYDFGDGNSAKGQETKVTHRYDSPGTYDAKIEVRLRDGDESCNSELDREVTIE